MTRRAKAPQADPIVAAIERHRRAWAACEAVCLALDEAASTGDKKAKRKLNRLYAAIDRTEDGLLDVIPKSIAGVTALLNYSVEHVRHGNGWGCGYVIEEPAPSKREGRHGVSWETLLHENIAEALPKIAAAAALN
jgi:hypothetical protein